MKICPEIRSTGAKEMSRQGELAFTMVEIAIAIGVIGFALVAIIGILPAGMNVQKDNREDTVISQDAPFFLDAIRNGAVVTNVYLYTAQGLDFLTNYVQSIRFDNYVNGSIVSPPNIYSNFVNGAEILGLLSTPQNNYNSPSFASNYFDVTATVRALSGPATEQNGLNGIMAFTYQMEVMVTPFCNFASAATNWQYAQLQGADPNQVLLLSNRWVEATPGLLFPSGALVYNLFDVRLRFSWPVHGTNVGRGRQTYRSLVCAPMIPILVQVNGAPMTNWFFQPQTFASAPPSNL